MSRLSHHTRAVPNVAGGRAYTTPTDRLRYGCGGCDRRWHARSVAHCAACHETFGSVHDFDPHRVGPADDRSCWSRADLLAARVIEDASGVWRRPQSNSDTRPGSAAA